MTPKTKKRALQLIAWIEQSEARVYRAALRQASSRPGSVTHEKAYNQEERNHHIGRQAYAELRQLIEGL